MQREQLPESLKSAKIRTYYIDLEKYELYDRNNARWMEAMDFQKRKTTKLVKRIQHCKKIHYFGFPNISMIIHLGYLLSLRYKIELYQHIRESSNSFWGWKSKNKPKGWKISIGDYEDYLYKRPTEIAISISQSGTVEDNDIVELYTDMPIIRISVNNPRIDDLKNRGQMEELVTQTKQIFDLFDFSKVLHLFCAIPSPVAFLLGQNISNTMNSKIQLYEFSASSVPKYSKSIPLN